MKELNRQEICAALGISESTIRRLEQAGLPFTPVGARSKRYDLAECKAWLRANPPGDQQPKEPSARQWVATPEFTALCKKLKLRVMPSED
jgi:predicted DNA-binding transcriptional regulator AlpA